MPITAENTIILPMISRVDMLCPNIIQPLKAAKTDSRLIITEVVTLSKLLWLTAIRAKAIPDAKIPANKIDGIEFLIPSILISSNRKINIRHKMAPQINRTTVN